MRKVIKGNVETGLVSLFLSLSLYHSIIYNNPCYLTSLCRVWVQVFSLRAGSLLETIPCPWETAQELEADVIL